MKRTAEEQKSYRERRQVKASRIAITWEDIKPLGRYTTEEAAKLLGYKVNSFLQVYKRLGLTPVELSKRNLRFKGDELLALGGFDIEL